MCKSNGSKINLGFADEKFPSGTHICQLYSKDSDREEALLQFLNSGLSDNERVACFSDKSNDSFISEFLTQKGHDCEAFKETSQLAISPVEPIYFKDNSFSPEVMLETLKAFQEDSVKEGQTAARVIGDMHPKITTIKGGDRLMEYEAKVCLLLETHPITAVCQYDIDAFDGTTIMNVLKVHPLMVVNGAVVRNPFFVAAKDILQQIGSAD
jgi:hypothetical protein